MGKPADAHARDTGRQGRPRRRLGWPLAILLAGLPAAGPARATPTLEQAVALHEAGRLDEALAAYREVAAASSAVPEIAATAHHNACLVLLDLGDYRGALAECRQALRLRRGQGDREGNGDPAELSRTLGNLGLALQVLGETAEAEQRFSESLALDRRLGDAEGQVLTLANLGALALATGRYSQALAYQTAAARLAAAHPAAPWSAAQLRIARINQGVVLESLGAYREALSLYQEVDAAALPPAERAALLVNTGVVYRNLGDPVRAVAAFRTALDVYEGIGDQAALSNAYLNLGLAEHLNFERLPAAEHAFREALQRAEASGDKTEEVQDLFYLGRLLLAEKRWPEAEAAFTRCLAVAQQSGSAEGTWSAREGLGRIAAARGNGRAALAHFEQAIAGVERVRTAISSGALRSGYFGDRRAVYAAAIDTLAAFARQAPGQGLAERAFALAQRAKARDLLDVLGEGPNGPGGSGRPPRGRGPLAPATAGEIRARLGDATVLEYFLGESHLYLWILQGSRGSELRFVDLGPAAPLLAAVSEVHGALARGEEPRPGALAMLTRGLLAPAAGRAPAGSLSPAGSLGGDRLFVAPDGALHYLPFEILLPPDATVSYLPSASLLARPGGEGAPGDRFLGFGDPARPRGSPSPGDPAGWLVRRFELAPLTASSGELARSARRLGGSQAIFTGSQATEQALRASVARGARVVHFATHTVLDERVGSGAAILLTPGGADDGLVHPEEIAALASTRPADLTVLAACSTALGPAAQGRALASLTGSFLAAGSRAVLATLWDVGDEATAAFMDQLYDQLARGHPPAEALRRAKARLRADPRWSRPHLWAGYVLIGDSGPVAEGGRGGLIAGAAAFGLAALALLVLGRRRRRTPGGPGKCR